MKIDVTFDLMNCNISNTVPVKDGKTSNLKTVDFATSFLVSFGAFTILMLLIKKNSSSYLLKVRVLIKYP